MVFCHLEIRRLNRGTDARKNRFDSILISLINFGFAQPYYPTNAVKDYKNVVKRLNRTKCGKTDDKNEDDDDDIYVYIYISLLESLWPVWFITPLISNERTPTAVCVV